MHKQCRAFSCLSRSWLRFFTSGEPSPVTSESESHTADLKTAKPFDDIPGPWGLPYFGMYFHFKMGFLNMYKYPEELRRWYKQFGGIMKETLIGHTVVRIFDPEFIKYVYANEGKFPSIEPLMETVQLYREKAGMSPGLGHTNDEEWYRLRSAVQQMMMRPREVHPFLEGVDQVAQDFVMQMKHLRNSSLEVPDFATELARWSLESSGANCFSRRLGYLTDKGKAEAIELIKANSSLFHLTTKLKFSLPLYKFFPSPSWKKLVAVEDIVHRVCKQHVEKAVKDMKAKADSNTLQEGDFRFLRYLLSRKELTMSDVTTLTLSLFIDGLLTTVPSLLFTMYCLATHPSAQEKALEEIFSSTSSSSPITADSFSQMTYLRACIKEAARMYPNNPEITRISKKDMVIGGYHIPPGTSLRLNNYVLFRDPTFFEEPNSFIPERWLRDGSVQKIHPFIVLQFGHGPRMCAGRRFAEQDMIVILTRILRNFHVEWHHSPMGQKYLLLIVPDCPAQFTFHDR